MTRKQAIDFISNTKAKYFRYGDLGFLTSRDETIADIENMDDDEWGNGIIYECNEKGELLC